MIEIERDNFENKADDYLDMFEAIFGGLDIYHLPADVFYFVDRGKRIGFYAGYALDMRTYYIQYAGVLDHNRTPRKARQCFARAVEHCAERGFANVMCLVESKNNAALRLILGIGFNVIGLRNGDGGLHVELGKRGDQ